MHEEGTQHSLADYNRAGVPLLEIVSEPDMSSGAAAAAYGAEIRRIVRFLGVSNGNMQVVIPPHDQRSPAQELHMVHCKSIRSLRLFDLGRRLVSSTPYSG
jgi:hypothetical protein